MKKADILRLFLPGIIVIFILACIFVFLSSRDRVDYSELAEVRISDTNAFACVCDEYTLTRENGTWVAARSNFSANHAYHVVSDAFANRIKAILEENNAHRWDGFNSRNDFVYDASSIHFYMRFSDGREINASGYAAYPENFYIVLEKFENLFEEQFGE